MGDLLQDQPWYHGLLPREDLPEMLRTAGDFIVRSTEPTKGEKRQYVVSVMIDESDKEQGIKHIVMKQTDENKYHLVEGTEFDSVPELINFYEKLKDPLHCGFPVLLKHPVGKQAWEKSHNDVTLKKKLGEGAFGEVHSGTLRVAGLQVPVAVKLAKIETLTKEQTKIIMREARIMRKFNHPNVVKFYGVAANQEPLMVIMELADNGAMDSFLRKCDPILSMNKKIEICYQVAKGLDYLHEINVIHRDIALRNCLLGGGQAKISDFGMSREGATYVLGPKRKVPIRWLAPEVMTTRTYNTKSDVWSYGVLCWECFTNGEEPYKGMKTSEVVSKVKAGYRMSFPKCTPEEVDNYITRIIWALNDGNRPTMRDILTPMHKWAEQFNPSRSPIKAGENRKSATQEDGSDSSRRRQQKKKGGSSSSCRHVCVDDIQATANDEKEKDPEAHPREGTPTKNQAGRNNKFCKKKDTACGTTGETAGATGDDNLKGSGRDSGKNSKKKKAAAAKVEPQRPPINDSKSNKKKKVPPLAPPMEFAPMIRINASEASRRLPPQELRAIINDASGKSNKRKKPPSIKADPQSASLMKPVCLSRQPMMKKKKPGYGTRL